MSPQSVKVAWVGAVHMQPRSSGSLKRHEPQDGMGRLRLGTGQGKRLREADSWKSSCCRSMRSPEAHTPRADPRAPLLGIYQKEIIPMSSKLWSHTFTTVVEQQTIIILTATMLTKYNPNNSHVYRMQHNTGLKICL